MTRTRDADAVAKAYDEIIDAVAGLQLKANKAALRAMIAKAEEVLGSKDAYVAETLEGLEEFSMQQKRWMTTQKQSSQK